MQTEPSSPLFLYIHVTGVGDERLGCYSKSALVTSIINLVASVTMYLHTYICTYVAPTQCAVVSYIDNPASCLHCTWPDTVQPWYICCVQCARLLLCLSQIDLNHQTPTCLLAIAHVCTYVRTYVSTDTPTTQGYLL